MGFCLTPITSVATSTAARATAWLGLDSGPRGKGNVFLEWNRGKRGEDLEGSHLALIKAPVVVKMDATPLRGADNEFASEDELS